jgi:hypothetical protein
MARRSGHCGVSGFCGPNGSSALLATRANLLFALRAVRVDQCQIEPWPHDRRQGPIVAPAQFEAVASFLDGDGLEPVRPRAFGLGQDKMIEINLLPIFGQRRAVGSRIYRARSMPCLA